MVALSDCHFVGNEDVGLQDRPSPDGNAASNDAMRSYDNIVSQLCIVFDYSRGVYFRHFTVSCLSKKNFLPSRVSHFLVVDEHKFDIGFSGNSLTYHRLTPTMSGSPSKPDGLGHENQLIAWDHRFSQFDVIHTQ